MDIGWVDLQAAVSVGGWVDGVRAMCVCACVFTIALTAVCVCVCVCASAHVCVCMLHAKHCVRARACGGVARLLVRAGRSTCAVVVVVSCFVPNGQASITAEVYPGLQDVHIVSFTAAHPTLEMTRNVRTPRCSLEAF